MEKNEIVDTAHRVRWICEKIFDYAVSNDWIPMGINPASNIEINPANPIRMAAVVDPADVTSIIRATDAYSGTAVVRAALRLLPMLAQRPGMLRKATWSEFDLDQGWWRVPGSRLKKKRQQLASVEDHWVPLPAQAIETLRSLRPLTGRGNFVFPNQSSPERPMSENTINAALRAMGFAKEFVTGHGFRSTFRTIMDEVLYVDPLVLEAQLAHKIAGPLGDTYARADYKAFRCFVMQMWADYLDALRAGPAKAQAFVETRRATFGPRRLEMDAWKRPAEARAAVSPGPTHTSLDLIKTSSSTWSLPTASSRVAGMNVSYAAVSIPRSLPAPVSVAPA